MRIAIQHLEAAAPPAEAPAERGEWVLVPREPDGRVLATIPGGTDAAARATYMRIIAAAQISGGVNFRVDAWSCEREAKRGPRCEKWCERGHECPAAYTITHHPAAPAAPAEGVACGKCGARQPLRHSPDCGIVAPRVTGGREDAKDAARYRWLREQHNSRDCDLAVMYDDGMIEDRHLHDAECIDLDAAIDAALQAANGGGES